MADEIVEYLPPRGPPPLLTFEQVRHLAVHGWLPIDLSADLVDGLRELSDAASVFFALSHEEKTALYPANGTECGFYHVPDEKEYITFRHLVHADCELEQHVRKVWHNAGILLHRILCDLSRAGGYRETQWNHLLDGTLELPDSGSDMDHIISLMRVFRYYPTSGYATQHVDIGLLTLCVGEGQGLQMLDRVANSTQWINADGPVVLVGDFTRALLDNRVRAGVHRVIGNRNGRHSTVFALRPCLRHPTDLAAFDRQGIVDTKEYFHQVKGRKFNINATQEIREKQRQAQGERKSNLQQKHASHSTTG